MRGAGIGRVCTSWQSDRMISAPQHRNLLTRYEKTGRIDLSAA